MKKIIIFIALLIIIIIILIVLKKRENIIKEEQYELPGQKTDKYLEGYNENIKSNNIVSFIYNNPDYYVECKLDNDILHIISRGETASKRDGSAFRLDYEVTDKSFLNTLQKIVQDYNISKNNGHDIHVNGLPAGLGDYIIITYDTEEKIYKSSNQSLMLNKEEINAIYDAFHKLAIDNNYDFTTEKSNQEIYNDATVEFLQGKWKGTHFGDEYIIEFNEKNIKIYKNNKLIDDTEYVIINGDIKRKKLRRKVAEPKDEYDYEEFTDISSIRKKNDIFLVAYFTKESYSTMELLIQK